MTDSKPPLSGRIITRYTSVNWIDCLITPEVIFASRGLNCICRCAGKLTLHRWRPIRITMRMITVLLEEESRAASAVISSNANEFDFFAFVKTQAQDIDFTQLGPKVIFILKLFSVKVTRCSHVR